MPGFDSRTAHFVLPPIFVLASVTASGVWYSLLGHVNGLYACLRALIHHGERIQGYFGKSAVDAHLFECETEMDSQDPEIDMLDRMGVEKERKAVSG